MKSSIRWIPGLLCAACFISIQQPLTSAATPWVISGNETKIDLSSGAQKIVPNAGPDSLSLLDFSTFPPKVIQIDNVPNTVIGPPSNIAIDPAGKFALIANSIQIDPANPTNYIPNNQIHLLDLTANPPQVTGHLTSGAQPSGMSFTPDGKTVLVANRAAGSVSVIDCSNGKPVMAYEIDLGKPEESFSDVAINPEGTLALVSAQKGSYLALLENNDGKWVATPRKISVYGQPYRVIISPDGKQAFTAGAGLGNGLDADAISVIELNHRTPKTTGYLPIGSGPESIEISPDGKMLVAVVMNGSNLERTNPNWREHGKLEVFHRQSGKLNHTQSIEVGAIPEGVAFTPNGKYLLVQCHPAREIMILQVGSDQVRDTGKRIKVPGMPSSIRASR